MATFIYVATDSIIESHIQGQTYEVQFDLQRAPRKRQVTRNVAESLSGNRETLKHYGCRSYSLQFAPVRGDRLDELSELLDSMEDGQIVTVYLYGTEAAPKRMLRTDDGHDFEEFMPVGTEDGDWYTTTIELREV